MKEDHWSPDACFGEALNSGLFSRSEMVYKNYIKYIVQTIYNYIDLGLMTIKNVDLPMKLRRTTKPTRVKKHKKKLGRSIKERPLEIESREEFGHWEIDTVIGEKSCNDNVLLTLVERLNRNAIVRKIESKTAEAVMKELLNIRKTFGKQFSQVFKTITCDNGSEFADLSRIKKDADTKIYFTQAFFALIYLFLTSILRSQHGSTEHSVRCKCQYVFVQKVENNFVQLQALYFSFLRF